jgi:hypothetical protein
MDPSIDLHINARSLEPDEALWALYEHWCKYHGISRSRAEMKRRFGMFKRAAKRVHKGNAGSERPIMALGPRADLMLPKTIRIWG